MSRTASAVVAAAVLTLAFAFAVTSAGAVSAPPRSDTNYPGQVQQCAPVVAMPDQCQPPENQPPENQPPENQPPENQPPENECENQGDPLTASANHECQPPEPCEDEGDPAQSPHHEACPPAPCPAADPGHMDNPGDPVQQQQPEQQQPEQQQPEEQQPEEQQPANCPPPPPVCPGDPACPPPPPPPPPVCPGDPACPPPPPPPPPVCPGDPSCPPVQNPGPTAPAPDLTAPVVVPAALAVEPTATESSSAPAAAAAVAGASTGKAKIAVSGAGARGPAGCIQRSFRVAVRGSNILRVDFTLDGRTLARVTKRDASGLYRTRVSLAGVTRSSHRIQARVAFRPNVAPRVINLPVSFLRCAQIATAPAFTG